MQVFILGGTIEDGHYHTSYIDPTGLGTSYNIPDNSKNALAEILGIQQATTNVIQFYKILHAVEGSEEREIEINNVHCGPFIGHILSQLARGGLKVEGDRIKQLFVNGGWEDYKDMSEEESRKLGENIRESDLDLLTGRQENLSKSVTDDGKLTSDFLRGLEDIIVYFLTEKTSISCWTLRVATLLLVKLLKVWQTLLQLRMTKNTTN